MSTAPLKALTIEHLRGSVLPFTLCFEKGKKLTVVYGENGSGKSTICDAFEFLARGQVGSIEGRGLGKTTRYWATLGKDLTDVAVTLETSAATCRASVSRTGVVAVPPEHRPRVEVLRRAQILKLLEAKPGERYEAVRRFVDVSGVETSEAALREAIKDLTQRRDTAVTRIQENRDTIRHFWEEAGSPGADPMAWAEQQMTRAPGSFDTEIQALEDLARAYTRFSEAVEQYLAADEQTEVARTAARDAEAECSKWKQRVAADASDVVELLEAAKAYLARHTVPSTCPLCEGTEHVSNLADRVDQRLDAFVALREAQAIARTCTAAADRAEESLAARLAEAQRYANELTQCQDGHTWPADVRLPSSPIPALSEHWLGWLTRNAELPASWREHIRRREDTKKFFGALKRALNTHAANLRAEGELAALLPPLRRILEIVEEERR